MNDLNREGELIFSTVESEQKKLQRWKVKNATLSKHSFLYEPSGQDELSRQHEAKPRVIKIQAEIWWNESRDVDGC